MYISNIKLFGTLHTLAKVPLFKRIINQQEFVDTCYNMKGKYELELISTCSMKHNQLSQRSNIQTSTKMMGNKQGFQIGKYKLQ